MTKTIGEAQAYVDHLAAGLAQASTADEDWPELVLLPAHTALAAVRDRLDAHGLGRRVGLGAQDAHWTAEGPLTGEVSMRMVHEAGASFVLVGHSERRALGESDAVVSAKAAAAVAAGLTPIIAVGEAEELRDRPRAAEQVLAQVLSATAAIDPDDRHDAVVAYEPVWAIGRERGSARPSQVAPVLASIREALAVERPAMRARLVYGGSVGPADVAALRAGVDLDGLFVGRAAWTPSGLLAIAQAVVTGTAASGTAAPPLAVVGRR